MIQNIAIFASGSGSNAENIIRYFNEHKQFHFPLIVSNRADAYVLERAKLLNVPSMVLSREAFRTGEAVLELLREYAVDAVVLAGFLLKVPDLLIENFPGRIVNIHPALLPKFGGKGMYGDHVHRAVLDADETETGITIHYVNSEYDEGDIIFQASCEVNAFDSVDSVAEKVHQLEFEHFPKIIEMIWGEVPKDKVI